jgi:hypothetical protein
MNFPFLRWWSFLPFSCTGSAKSPPVWRNASQAVTILQRLWDTCVEWNHVPVQVSTGLVQDFPGSHLKEVRNITLSGLLRRSTGRKDPMVINLHVMNRPVR